MIELNNLYKSFGKKHALQNVSLEIRQGECFGLVGPNGAGKTTLINLITGFLSPDAGCIKVAGQTISRSVKQLIGLVPQEIALYENLSVLDNLTYFGELYNLSGSRLSGRIHELLTWVGLADRKRDRVKTLSGGMKRRLNLIAGLLHSPQFLLVDEPTVGLDPQARVFIYDLISQLKQIGTAILYTTHYLPEVEQLCDRIAVLHEGRVVALGTPEELVRRDVTPQVNLESVFFELTGTEVRD